VSRSVEGKVGAPQAGLVADLEFRGLWFQETGSGLRALIDAGALTCYIGFDPTADSLHVGHLLQLCLLRRLQLAGHRPIALAGGGTGMVGDPGGKSEERVLLTDDEVNANLAGIRPQLERFVELGDSAEHAGLLLDNRAWLGSLGLLEFLRDVGKHFTVNDMVSKESVRSRLERAEQGISYTEFSYMLLQAYDFLYLFDHHDCRLQLGGSDQFGNITMGVELIRKIRGAKAYGLTSPLVLKADGTKFGKTEEGTVWLDARRTSPFVLYQFFLRTDDADVGPYLRYFTFLAHEQIVDLDAATAARPAERTAQRALAHAVCAMVHGEEETRRAEHASEALYSEEISTLDERTLLEVCAEAPSSDRSRGELEHGLGLVEALAESGLVGSRSQARTTISQGGAYVNNRRESDPERKLRLDDLLVGRYVVLRRGRRDYHLLRFG
jgi:tyrosyl-tRNA synthetase